METTEESKTAAGGDLSREARRRKILARGTDRLAFITGQTRAVPPPPPHSADPRSLSPRNSAAASDEQNQQQRTRDQKQLREVAAALPDEDNSKSLKSEPVNEAPRKSLVRDIGIELLPKSKRSAEAVPNTPKTTVSSGRLFSPVTGHPSSSIADTMRRVLPQTSSNIFTSSRISDCISSSENIRLLFATVIALLVVLSYHGYAPGKAVTSLVSYGPIFLVLLTDATLVLGLLFTSQAHEKHEDVAETCREEFDLAELLQIGFVVHNVMKAVFMDCCLCAVAMIIGNPFGAV